jgi:hypothetical protein
MLTPAQLQFLLELLNNPNSTVSINRAKVCASTMEELETQLALSQPLTVKTTTSDAAPLINGGQ